MRLFPHVTRPTLEMDMIALVLDPTPYDITTATLFLLRRRDRHVCWGDKALAAVDEGENEQPSNKCLQFRRNLGAMQRLSGLGVLRGFSITFQNYVALRTNRFGQPVDMNDILPANSHWYSLR
ncbi:hypothetical protein AVEN_80966-1 [Araneus ventricosus]|uniref:Uncharacterized protein n=1 Tax=Araneus ventricosus TaxID=182803 RepID=A0A4Y2VVI7_ARAVE|nr:hypothetical protein AVEN_80966-1 [Araneus ventricosus]